MISNTVANLISPKKEDLVPKSSLARHALPEHVWETTSAFSLYKIFYC